MFIMGIDPGGSTGICVLNTETNTLEYKTLGPDEHHRDLQYEIIRQEVDVIICERFQNRGKADAVIVSGEYVGVVKLTAELYKISLELQIPDQKEWWTNEKLAQAKLYVPGAERRHEMDALRHILYYMTFTVGDKQWVNRLRG